ncbi:MAG: hypothetical protein HOP11_11550, partial [Saprospiraceae bacterium]|nr:hypothetical protein [Saprospiraceae bacterium]
MSFYNQTGFRAGTSHPFFFYDLAKEKITSLKIFPVIAMDRTYLKYLQYNKLQTLQDFSQLISEVKKFGGHTHVIWHNSSFDFQGEWIGYEGVFDEII